MLSPDQIKSLQYLACVALGAWVVARGIIPGWTTPHSDFNNYYVSSRLVAQGANLDSLYNNEWFQQQIRKAGASTPGKFAPFPPITSWVMLPLASLGPLQAQRAFLIVNLLFGAVCVYAWKKVTGWTWLASALTVLAGGASFTNNLAFGQLYLIMAASLLLGIVMVKSGKVLMPGIIFGVFAAIKYFPAVIVAGICALCLVETPAARRKYLLVTFYFVITIMVLVLVQIAFFGSRLMIEYLNVVLLPHLSSELAGQGMYSFPFQSWDSLARNLFVYDPVANPEPWIDWPAGRSILKMIISLSVIAITVVILFINRRSPQRTNIFVAMPALGSLVLLPASATYHFILLLFPLSLLFAGGCLDRKRTNMMLVIYIAIGFIPYAAFFDLGRASGLLFAYPRLWLVTLMFGLAAWCLSRNSSSTPVQ